MTRALARRHEVGAVDVLVKAMVKERVRLVRDALENALAVLAPPPREKSARRRPAAAALDPTVVFIGTREAYSSEATMA